MHNVTNLLSKTGYYISSTRAWRISSTSGKEVSQADGDSYALTQIKNALSLDTKTGNTVTLYANWRPYKLTVKYNANGGSGAPSATQMYYGSNYQLSQNQQLVQVMILQAGELQRLGVKQNIRLKINLPRIGRQHLEQVLIQAIRK